MSLRYVTVNGGPALVLADPALASMQWFRQTGKRSREAGGQLFANFEGSDTLIVEATPPKLFDRRTRHGFRPNRTLQRREIRHRYKRGFHFVGDWHTHPEPIPQPSADDLKNMQDCFSKSVHALRAFVMIILGTNPWPTGIVVALVGVKTVQILTSPDNP